MFGRLFAAYDDEGFKRSVALFGERFGDAGFDLGWFAGKSCLDAGCGGGRYSIALARLGARRVEGIDLGEVNIADARQRAEALGAGHVNFQVGSVAALPFDDASFDGVICSGVLMHTADPVKVLDELARVVRPGGLIYMLVYATEGLRWPLVQMLRPIAAAIGFEAFDAAVGRAGLPLNRRRTYLDDLFVPFIDFYTWQSLAGQLRERGFATVTRWERGRLDHEETIEAYARDLGGFREILEAIEKSSDLIDGQHAAAVSAGLRIATAVHDHACSLAAAVASGAMPAEEARRLAIGQGHHRLVGWKAK